MFKLEKGSGCAVAQSGKLLESSMDAFDCTDFEFDEGRRALKIASGCVDYFAGRGFGLYSCHYGSNQRFNWEGGQFCGQEGCLKVPLETREPS